MGIGADRRPGYLYVVVKGQEPLELRVAKKVTGARERSRLQWTETVAEFLNAHCFKMSNAF